MRIFKLWIITGIIFGIGEITRVWHTHQSSEGSNGFFQLRFWEALLAGNFQKIVVLNLGLNLLFILGKWMQMLFLGRLRELESYKSGDRIRDYVLMKTVFIGAIVGSGGGEDDEKEILIWFVWLTAVGFLKHFGLLCRDRLEYMTLSINSSISAYSRVMALLCLVFIGNLVLVQLCLSTFGCWSNCPPGGLSALALLLFECVVVGIDCGQTMVRFLVHFVNEARAGRWEHRGFYLFSSELLCELLVHSLTLLHLLHVWFLHGLSLSLTDALLFIHTRTVMHSIHGKIGALRTYVTMDRRFRDASKEELVSNDDHCSICHEPMSSAKVLPCGHMFHLVCLRGWLEHSPTCPICRRPVQPTDTQGSGTGAGADAAQEVDADMQNAARQMLQDLMQGEEADRRAHGENGGVALLQEEPMIRRQSWTIGWGGGGNGWMSWLPRFSIEVVRQHVTRDEGGGRRFFAVDVGAGQGIDQGNGAEGISTHHHEEALDAAVAQVLGVLPDLCPHAVREDLMLTGDIQVTLERGLEGQIQFRSEPSPAEAEPVVTEALPSEQIQFRSEPSPAEAESMATDASSAEPGPSRGDAQERAFPSAAVDSLAIGDGDSGQGDGTAVSETAGFRDSRGGCEVTAHTDRLDGHATCTVKCPENADGVHPHGDEDERLEASIREAISSGAEAGMAGAAAGGDTCDRAFDSAT